MRKRKGKVVLLVGFPCLVIMEGSRRKEEPTIFCLLLSRRIMELVLMTTSIRENLHLRK